MGDIDTPNENETSANTSCKEAKPSIDILKEAKPSIDILKEAKPSANIAISESTPDGESSAKKSLDEIKIENQPETIGGETKKEKIALKNRSDIFSLNENKNLTSTIFSIGGAPSKTIHKSGSSNSQSSNETISTQSSATGPLRNPLTGIGVSSNDEFRNKPSKRKDGNPLLGVGYKDDDTFFQAPNSQRIPPGGHSNGLW